MRFPVRYRSRAGKAKHGGVHMIPRVRVTVAVAMIFGWMLSLQGWAQTEKPYPTRQITYIICFDPGGQSDRAARMQHNLYSTGS
jgi:hypothetical protein